MLYIYNIKAYIYEYVCFNIIYMLYIYAFILYIYITYILYIIIYICKLYTHILYIEYKSSDMRVLVPPGTSGLLAGRRLPRSHILFKKSVDRI